MRSRRAEKRSRTAQKRSTYASRNGNTEQESCSLLCKRLTYKSRVLKSITDYKKTVNPTLEIFHATEGTSEADELALLLVLVKDYEDRHIPLPDVNPIEFIKLKMEEQGLKAKDLEAIIGSKGHVSSILPGRREITLKMAQRLKDYFKLPAAVFLKPV